MDPHAIGVRKRAYSGDSSDCQNTTLIGNYWAKAGGHNDRISTRHQQQNKRLFRQVSPVPPFVSVWDHTTQNSPELYRGLVVTSSPGRLNRASPGSLEPSSPGSAFLNIQTAPLLSPSSQSPSIPFGNVMREERRHQPRAVAKYPTDSGSDDSRALHESALCAANQGEGLEFMFNIPDDLSYTFASEALSDYQLTEDLGRPAGHDMVKFPEPLLTQGQDGQYPGIWPQQEIELPWSHIDASYGQAVLTQRPRTSWPEELLEGSISGSLVQHLNPSSVYPSHISSPHSNASWHPSEMVLLTSTFPDHAQGSYPDEDLISPEPQDQPGTQAKEGPERERSQFLPLIYNMQDPSPRDSWDAVDMSRSVHFIPEDFALTDWPTPLNRGLSNSVSRTTNSFSSCSQRIPRGVDDQFLPMSERAVPKTLKERKWEHTIVSDGTIQQLDNQITSKGYKKKKGRRKGPLPVDVARKAGEVRQNRACWRCWLLHLSCSVDQVCDKCQNPLSFRVCNKAHLYDYTELFFPELVVARRHPSAVQQLIDENIAGFTANKIQVQLSSGSNSPPMTLTVYEFVPTNYEFLFLYWTPPDVNASIPNPERIYAPPLGLLDNKDQAKLQDTCQEHIKSLIKHNQYCKDATNSNAAPVSWEAYEAVNRYRKSSRMLGNAELIRKVMKLHVMYFFMSRIIDFTEDSAKKVAENLRPPVQSPYGHSVSSKLLTHQIKREMNILQYELTLEILEKLQTELRRRSKASWATSFCVILILSMCMEAVQVSVDGFIVQKMLENDGTNTLPASRSDGFEIARRLDHLAFKDCIDIFHMIYRSGESTTGSNKGGFNPIRDGIEMDRAQGIDEDTVQLVNEIRRIMSDHYEEIEEKAKNPSCDDKGDVLANHYRFRRENSGRLVARFLRSFQEVS